MIYQRDFASTVPQGVLFQDEPEKGKGQGLAEKDGKKLYYSEQEEP